MTDPRTLRLLADLLAYPRPGLAVRCSEFAAALAPSLPPAAERVARFGAWARAEGPTAAEEAYTAAFDLAPIASPYVGDQLFGASRERSLFLSGLRELQQDAGLEPGTELPDHLSEVLRLVAAPIPGDVRDDLLSEGLAPALAKVLAALEGARHPWADVVAAAVEVVRPLAAEPAAQRVEVTP